MNFTPKLLSSIAFTSCVGLLVMTLAGCSTLSGTNTGNASQETIGYSVGPCFGFCPVYSVAINPGGHVTYVGEKNTTVVGPKETDAGATGYGSVSNALATYRPKHGTTADTQCNQRRTDQQHYTITWTGADGTQTVLRHDKGCISSRNESLNKVLEGLPDKLGIAEWVKQKALPGATHG